MQPDRRRALTGLAATAASAALAGCAAMAPTHRAPIVLVHGAWHGSWCWDKLTPLLRARGHAVHAVDLHVGAPEQASLAGYARTIEQALDAQPAPAILLAHSSGALAASQAAEERPEKVATLAWLSGFVAKSGQAQRELMGADPLQKVSAVLMVDFRPGTRIPLQTRIDTAKADAVKLAFYDDCSEADANAAISRLVPEPAAPSVQQLRLTEERFGRVPKAYIHCTRDNAISLPRQRQFAAQWPLKRTLSLDSSHSPFLSMPDQLAQAIFSL